MSTEPADTLMGGIGALLVGGAGFAVFWLKEYFKGKNEEDTSPRAKHVILEQAEIANLGDLPRLIKDLAPKLDAMYPKLDFIADQERSAAHMADANHEILKSFVPILRKLENNIDFQERLRQEEILRQRQEQGRRDERDRQRDRDRD